MELPQVVREREPQAPGMRSALWLPLFDDLADPVVVARLAAEAEEESALSGSTATGMAGFSRHFDHHVPG